jgi:hypothetical protein
MAACAFISTSPSTCACVCGKQVRARALTPSAAWPLKCRYWRTCVATTLRKETAPVSTCNNCSHSTAECPNCKNDQWCAACNLCNICGMKCRTTTPRKLPRSGAGEYGGRLYICAGLGGMLVPVDTRNGKAPYTRHRAIISKINIPFGFGKNLRVLGSEIAYTRCNKTLHNYNDATQVSLRDSEGGEYSRECTTCFEDNPATK